MWQPSFGAWPEADGTWFRVWAPEARSVEVLVDRRSGARVANPLTPGPDGLFAAFVAGVGAGDRYAYRLDAAGPYPDPASRYQPDGVHGTSEIVDPTRFAWSDARWPGVALNDLVVYELHVGTFTPDGTFAAVAERLPHLVDLGVTAIELMPVADFPGGRNWGYDGAALFAPARCYGRPDDLRRLVDAAHARGLAVLLDVVYNHVGPDGAYLPVFAPPFFSSRHRSPWGAGINLDGPGSGMVRRLLIENALHWVHEYHVDGLRLDATHAIADDGPGHFLAELAAALHDARPDRRVLAIAEDHRNLAVMITDEAEGGWGLDAVWADDFHHQARRLLAGDRDGYYRDFTGSIDDLAATIRHGWFFTGQHSIYLDGPRGTDPSGLPPRRFVICLQNHDQIGNRAFGERLHHQIDLAAYRAATVLLLCCPQTPLLFMGQEWAASTPFLYFTDHHPELGRLVTEGRRHEFRHFAAFADSQARDRIPDPQALDTLQASRLRWEECNGEPHASTLRLYRRLLALRRTEPALEERARDRVDVAPLDAHTLALWRRAAAGPDLLAVVRLRGGGVVRTERVFAGGGGPGRRWSIVLTSEDAPFAPDPAAPRVDVAGAAPKVEFRRPSAVVLRAGP